MGNSSPVAGSAVHSLVSTLQAQLNTDRAAGKTCGTLPRSSQVDGRFVLDPKHFPGVIEYSSISDLIAWKSSAEPHPVYTKEFLDASLPVLLPSKTELEKGADAGEIQATWLGHATVLAQFNGWNVIVDPIFSERCSPSQWFGPSRLRPSPVRSDLTVLPPLDVCCISHNHYDHLDLNTVLELSSRHPQMIYCVPLGMKQWMEESGVANPVLEMDWSESAAITDTTDQNRCPITVRCIPCQHWCARGRLDRNKCLWSAWSLETSEGAFFFGGDTAYCPLVFKRVPEALGKPISLAALPIGAYGSDGEKWFHKHSHMNPAEAVETHKDIKAKASIGVHWGTFMLTGEDIMEPPALLQAAKNEVKLNDDAFIVLKHGETKSFKL